MNAKAVLILAIEAHEKALDIMATGLLPRKTAEELVLAAVDAVWKLRMRVLDVSDIPFFNFYEDEAA